MPLPYHRPTELSDALDLVARTGGKIIAGGTDVYPALQKGKTPADFVDLTVVAELSGIRTTRSGFRIGATATWTDLLRADLPPAFDGLKAAAREVGSVQIQNAGTIAGNLCNASPAADGVPPLLTLDARVELAHADTGTRQFALSEFITGVRQTALMEGEVLTAITIPAPPFGSTASFEKLGSRRYLVISIAMVSVLLVLDDVGAIAQARVAVGACSPVAQRLTALETALIGAQPDAVHVNADHLSPLSPIDDVRGGGGYRLDAVAEQIARAIAKAVRND